MKEENQLKFMLSLREPTSTYVQELADKRGLTVQEVIRDILGKEAEKANPKK